MANQLESSIHSILARAASDLAAAVRAAIAVELERAIGGAAPVARGRRARAAVGPRAAGARGKRPRSDRSYSDADIARVLDVIRDKPGLLPSQYRSEARMNERAFARLIGKLKDEGRIKVIGKARKTSYVVA